MKKEDFRIVFMGTPAFAVPSLRALIQEGYSVPAVVTAPDRQAGRGRKWQASPVKEFALEHQLMILQPEKLRDPSFIDELRSIQPQLIVVVAFRMLPEQVWSIPELGTFNLHASLLPQYRGAAPINHAIINGEKESGLTTFFIDHEIDTGRIIAHTKMKIGEDEIFGDVHDRMMDAGAALVLETAEMIREGRASTTKQEDLALHAGELKKAPKLTKNFCRIDWSKQPGEVHNFIRGLSPYPAAYTHLVDDEGEGDYFKIFRCGKETRDHRLEPGVLLSDGRSYLKVAVSGGFISLNELQQAGKRAMSVEDFLNGFRFETGMKFG